VAGLWEHLTCEYDLAQSCSTTQMILMKSLFASHTSSHIPTSYIVPLVVSRMMSDYCTSLNQSATLTPFFRSVCHHRMSIPISLKSASTPVLVEQVVTVRWFFVCITQLLKARQRFNDRVFTCESVVVVFTTTTQFCPSVCLSHCHTGRLVKNGAS